MDKEQNDFISKMNVPTAILAGSVIIALAIIFTNTTPSTPFPNGQVEKGSGSTAQKVKLDPITDEDHFYGNPKAKVVLVEYSDLECPFCKIFHPTIQRLVDESQGQIAWVYRHFPLDNIHSKARKEAEATECAAELGGNEAFWNYTNEIFRITPSNDRLDLSELPKIAVRIGLERVAFEKCLNSGKYAKKVESHFQSGQKAGVTGTPASILVNQKGETIFVPGAQSYESLKAAAEQLY